MDSERWAKVEALYHSALSWDAAERAARLRRACGSDEELLREVEALLAAGQAPPSLLETSSWNPGSGLLPTGIEIASYRIEGVIGTGGMGVVYRATDTRLKRPV